MEKVDSLIHGRWVVPVVPSGQILENHCVVINGSKIIDIIPSNEVLGLYQALHESHLGDHLILPGFVNAHCHAAMSLFRGIADDLELKTWLEQHIWPLERKFVDEDFVEDGTNLAIAEMIRSGTTCFVDMYHFPQAAARAVREAGIRARIGLVISDSATAYAATTDDYFNNGLDFADRYKHDPLISCHFAPHAPYSVSDEPLKRMRVLSTELGFSMHMHIHETKQEVDDAVKADGMRPLKRLEQLELLTPDLHAVHMTELSIDEINSISENGVHVIHCPESNMKLASGSCPVNELLNAGVNVALGTDGAACNNDLDMLSEMKSAAFLGKLTAKNAAVLSATTVLEMATINGATALGLEDLIGSLETGKQADVIAVDMSKLELQPLTNPISQLVYSSDRSQVTDLWVAGKQLMKQRQLTTLDVEEIINKAQQWRDKFTD